MTWRPPLPLKLIQTADSNSFASLPLGVTGLPLAPHPGAFGVRRAKHTHEGVDLYCPDGTPVSAVEDGVVLAVKPFTGPHAGLPWWLDTWAVFVEGASGVVVYGEVTPGVTPGQDVSAGEEIGRVTRVLRHDKGRPVSMLHIELRTSGDMSDIEWLVHEAQPATLLDPTPFLQECAE